jgi:hypothetical protein
MSVQGGDLLRWLGELALFVTIAAFIWWMAGDYLTKLQTIIEYAPR